MKKLLLSLLLMSNAVWANPTVFGLTIGETSVDQLKSKYTVNHTGTNKYSHGDMYNISRDQINFEGISDVTTVFDTSGKLVAVLTELPKNKFDYLHGVLGNKYQLVSQKVPFVGNKSATYKDGQTEITLNAPHMSFQLSMNYIHSDLMKAFNNQSKKEKQQKEQRESSML
ncbi:hypothetical protein [Vibrio nereis]|uniref:Uncharacterized protein n=1 Tax=Vibrio nereis TaxID=693 RepID=A0A0M0HRY5_VIBNE|nr:hypothetical protein [Vibrio nereis]KOO04826.1 hypothetical protein AKJ17_03940 [Vibrio nereis]KOO12091.1 hypothetical protein AKJ18_25755 [Vibrio xuii]